MSLWLFLSELGISLAKSFGLSTFHLGFKTIFWFLHHLIDFSVLLSCLFVLFCFEHFSGIHFWSFFFFFPFPFALRDLIHSLVSIIIIQKLAKSVYLYYHLHHVFLSNGHFHRNTLLIAYT